MSGETKETKEAKETQETKPYTTTFVASVGDPCGTISLYLAHVPRKTRLHHLWHSEFRGVSPTSITNWSQIWAKCAGWHDTVWEKKYCGKLKRGLMYSTGNGIRACVEYQDRLLIVHGVCG